MQKILKLEFGEGTQTLDIAEGVKIVASLYTDLKGAVLLVDQTSEEVTNEEAANAENL